MTDSRASARFAVYFVPPTGSAHYQLGSGLLGYDLRARQASPLPDFLRPEWQTSASPYGFHLTVVEGFYTDPERLGDIEREMRSCLACLAPGADVGLSGGHIEAWDDGETWVQRFTPSPALLVLHTLLLSRLSEFATASPFAGEVAEGKYNRPFEQARMRLLQTPRGLDTFQPHFTLVQPYGGFQAEELQVRLEALMCPHPALRIAALALCLKPPGETHWQILREVPLETDLAETD
ncbi:hypothetical protein GCM10022631_31050 [Deinococcus rubellus]|uniref:DUF1045 domain-containing protein n=1 Tax=Deinococcus rubellus TaxID=1889240 RepID=A0ABY5YF74_9DEIO|nr:hypothetical protein [Deinococcus rubellus]UWX63448.1 hypothetical protein N0D28_11925 [Deinococcus rubellus]